MDLDVHLAAIAAGDDEAFAAWLAGAEPRMRGALRSFAHAVDTEAVLQEALLRTWQVAPKVRLDGRENALLRFAVRIARNLAIDEARRHKLHIEAPPEEPLPPPEPPDPLLHGTIVRCLEALPCAPARAIRARIQGGAHDRDLAVKLEMTLNTFLKNIGRARKLLTDCLARQGIAVEKL